MIRKITIHNIALIEKISLDFHTGMHVLSGETGAGKSIIVDAVSLLLGGRAEKLLLKQNLTQRGFVFLIRFWHGKALMMRMKPLSCTGKYRAAAATPAGSTGLWFLLRC